MLTLTTTWMQTANEVPAGPAAHALQVILLVLLVATGLALVLGWRAGSRR